MGGLGQVTAGHASPCWGKHHLRFPETKTEAWGRGSHRGGWALAPPTPRPPSPQHAGPWRP